MRVLFVLGALLSATDFAFAADLPAAPMPAPGAPGAYIQAPPPATYNWSSIYIGGNGGYGFGTSNWGDPNNSVSTSSTGDFSANGWLGGGTVGANLQVSQFVVGAEADLDWSNILGSSTGTFCALTMPNTATASACQTKNTWLGTARGRVGYAVDNVFVYGTAGAAFGNIQAGLNAAQSYSSTSKVGWTAGAGFEVAFAPHWTWKVEYLYVDLGSGSCTTTVNCGVDNLPAGATPAVNDTVKLTTSIVRAGVNLRFPN
jgi:outer membrane immunogenic protein